MLFNTLEFFSFAILFFIFYNLISDKLKPIFLLGSSYYFYSFWSKKFLALILVSTVVDYFVGRLMGRETSPKTRKVLLLLSVGVNLSILGFFKYYNFFVDSFVSLGSLMGFELNLGLVSVVLPVGISFYTFQTMSYTIDIYRKKIEPCKSFIDFSVYVSYFPQLVAGPIERAERLLPQIKSLPKPSSHQIYAGIQLVIWGLFKKSVIADNVGEIVNKMFDSSLQLQDTSVAILGAYGFALQIYCDFSGYTDIARGISKFLGIDLMLNFNKPYLAVSITDFWRRWHISLSSWLRDYLYISIGGNRKGTLFTYRNLIITMLLGGLWHGASWMFVLWGAYHGSLLAIEKCDIGKHLPLRKANVFIKQIWVFHLVCFGWVLFRATDLTMFNYWLSNLFSFNFSGEYLHLYLSLFLMYLPIWIYWYLVKKEASLSEFKVKLMIPKALSYSLLILLIVLLSADENREFIYFQF